MKKYLTELLKDKSIPIKLFVGIITWLLGQIGLFIYNLFKENFSMESAWMASVAYMEYEIKVKWILIILLIAATSYYFLIYLRYKKNKYSVDINTKIGEYKFKELYNHMLTVELSVPFAMYTTLGKNLNLLELFDYYIRSFNLGVHWNQGGADGHFMYYKLGPELMSLGLTEKVKKKITDYDTENDEVIQTSENGYKFYALVQKLNLEKKYGRAKENNRNQA
jgi:hypothetical protein